MTVPDREPVALAIEALNPFYAYACLEDDLSSGHSAPDELVIMATTRGGIHAAVTVGDLRRARRAREHLAASAAAPHAPSQAAIETARENEAVRSAFVDCYTLQSIVTEERGNVVDLEDLQRWDEVESVLIRAIVAVVDALRAGHGPKEGT